MGVFPVIFDAAPSYVGKSSHRSLLLSPVGSGSLLCHLHSRLTAEGPYKLTIVPAFQPETEYRNALFRTCGEVERVVNGTDFSDFVASLEPSDTLLLIDPRHVVEEGLNPSLLFNRAKEAPGTVVHLTALDANAGGTSEWIDVDSHGQVSRIQRYYDDLTWSYAVGVAASLVPAWSLKTMRPARLTSLLTLRSALSSAGIPCRDIPLSGRTFDLSQEREFLMMTESVVRGLEPVSERTSSVASEGQIHESARIVGSVVVQSGAQIERNATVIGPAVIGAGATVGSGAIVVQCVVNQEVTVPAGSVVRHRLVSGDAVETPASQTPPAYDPLAVRGFRTDMPNDKPSARVYPNVKLIVESALAALALVILSPLMILVALLIKLESRGPVLFIDRREAKGRRTFGCLKFRTMRTGADLLQRQLRQQNNVDGPQFKMDKDPRLTRIGRWIRPCSIDELPQLINVMMGQMSLVGPRPSPFRENQTCVPWRDGRLSVRPGITGLWQVCRHNRGEGDFHQWIHYDLLYIQHMSAMVDVKIALATVLTLGGKLCVPLTWIIPPKKRPEQ